MFRQDICSGIVNTVNRILQYTNVKPVGGEIIYYKMHKIILTLTHGQKNRTTILSIIGKKCTSSNTFILFFFLHIAA